MGKKRRGKKPIDQSNTISKKPHDLRRWVIASLLAITFFAFANTLSHGFAYDDNTQILQNDLIRDISNIPTVLTTEVWFWRALKDKDPNEEAGPSTPYYRPVFSIYLILGWHLFGNSPMGWHLFNILMHMAVVYFVFLLIEKLFGNLWLSTISAVLFALHPLRSESVAWISGLTDPLLALFLLPAFYFYILYREGGKPKHLVSALALFLIAAFTKEPAVCLPIFIAAYELLLINQGEPIKRRAFLAARYAAMFLAVSLVYFVMRYFAIGFVLNDQSFTSYKTIEILMTTPIVICKYIGLLFWPVDLSIFHDTPMVKSPLSLRFILPLVAVAALALALWPLRKATVTRFAILWFVINLLPVLNLGTFQEHFLVQERYVYIPSIGFSLLIAYGLMKLPVERWVEIGIRRTVQAATVAVICLLLVGKTLAQNAVWKDDLTLYEHGAQTASEQLMSHFVLGHYYIKLQQPEKSVEELEKVLEMDPDNMVAIINLAPAHLQLHVKTMDRSHVKRAIDLCHKGLSKNDSIAPLLDTLGHAHTFDTEFKNYERARALFARALALQPNLFISNFHMGATFVKEGNYINAIPFLELARQQEPKFAESYKFLAYAYENTGRTRDAINQLSHYLRLEITSADAAKETEHLEALRAKLQSESP
ncbi:MAG: glycosyltransferase family 39 protein [Blastocatellia bacterium]|nr:glycosyltransferase family 39 protein [Blastocatellia bacterium]